MEIKDPQRPTPPKTKPPSISTSSSTPHYLQTFIFYFVIFSFGLVLGATFFPFNSLHQPEFSLPPPLPPLPGHRSNAVHSITDDDELLQRASLVDSRVKEEDKTKTKIAFLFLTIGQLPLAPLWEMFFHGYQGMYTIYMHSQPTYNESVHSTSVFFGRRIPSKETQWGNFNMVEAERRLLASALLDDASNHHFLLLSESCIPLFNFSTVYSYLTRSSTTFVDSNDRPGPTGRSRYNPHMLPFVALSQWRKGSQWFHLDRTLAIAVVSDRKYFPLFSRFCRVACYSDEHYLATFVGIEFGLRNSNRSLTWTEWALKQAHPLAFQRPHVTPEFLRILRGGYSCEYNGENTNVCFLFARKFMPSCLDRLMRFAPKFMYFGHARDLIHSNQSRH